VTVRKAAFIHSSQLDQYPYPADCPFNTSRAGKAKQLLDNFGLLSSDTAFVHAPVEAGRLLLKKYHSAAYIHTLKKANVGKIGIDSLNMGIGTHDCPVFKGMYEYSALAVGATVAAAKLIIDGKADVAFNPSGGFHHAMAKKAAGFCYLNDNTIAAMVLAEAGKRVLYLDVDVHHGDGVQEAFYDRDDVMTVSFHQDGRTLFPGTGFEDEIGIGKGKGYNVNLPLPIGTFDESYMYAFTEIAEPLIKFFKPDVILFELGADTLVGDPLANLCLTNNCYVDIINRLLAYDKPIIMTGGGGYHIENTVRAWALAWSVLSGADNSHDDNIGLGGVFLESTDWLGGWRDSQAPVTDSQRDSVMRAIDASIKKLKKSVFKIHGIA